MWLFECRRGDRSLVIFFDAPSRSCHRYCSRRVVLRRSASDRAGPHAHVMRMMLGSVADGLLQARSILNAYGEAIGGSEWGCRAREGGS